MIFWTHDGANIGLWQGTQEHAEFTTGTIWVSGQYLCWWEKYAQNVSADETTFDLTEQCMECLIWKNSISRMYDFTEHYKWNVWADGTVWMIWKWSLSVFILWYSVQTDLGYIRFELCFSEVISIGFSQFNWAVESFNLHNCSSCDILLHTPSKSDRSLDSESVNASRLLMAFSVWDIMRSRSLSSRGVSSW